MAYKTAHFKTAYLQREIVLDTKVSEALKVGALCTYTAGTNTLAGASTVDAATHMVAQSDMTMDKGHVPVEDRDYRYNKKVDSSTVNPKRVALFPIIDKNDVELDAE